MFKMWLDHEISKLRAVHVDNVRLEDYLTESEIEVIKGYYADSRWSNATRYNNLRNAVFVPKRVSSKVPSFYFIFNFNNKLT